MMVTREAMPAREAMRDNRGAVAGESRRRISYANGIPSENAGQYSIFDSLPNGIHGIIVIEPYHARPHINDERRGAGNSNGVLASIRSKLMLTCSTFCHCITNKPSQIPPILRIAGDISTSGGAS